jgi:hypothetical protein
MSPPRSYLRQMTGKAFLPNKGDEVDWVRITAFQETTYLGRYPAN